MHVSPRLPFGQYNVIRTVTISRSDCRGPANFTLSESTEASLRNDHIFLPLLALFSTDHV